MNNSSTLLKALAVALFLILSNNVLALSPNDLRPKPYLPTPLMTNDLRLKLLGTLNKLGIEYLAALNATSYQNFSSLNELPENIVSMVTELEDTRLLMNEFVKATKTLNTDPHDCKSWLLLLRNYYLVSGYMEDLDTRGIVKSEAYIGLRIWLPFVFDQILLPNEKRC